MPEKLSPGRDLTLLFGAQTVYTMQVSIDLTLSALTGLALAPVPALATLPLSLVMASGVLCSLAAGYLTARWGYRRVMAVGALGAIAGGIFSLLAVLWGSFPVLCLGMVLMGVYRSTGGYVRFLAADLAKPGAVGRTLGIVLSGGLIAAFAGPFVALWASELWTVRFAGSFALVAILGVVALPLPLFVSREPVDTTRSGGRPTAIATAVKSPDFRTAVVVLSLSGALMTLVMAVGPLASVHAGHSEAEGASLIQWHLVAMFAPSLFVGELLRRWGSMRVAMLGALATSLGAVAGFGGTGMPFMLAALVLAGLGWNLLFLAGSALLVRSYKPGTGGRVQAITEGGTGLITVLASFGAAAVFNLLGWRLTNVPVLLLSVALLFGLLVRSKLGRSGMAVRVRALHLPGRRDREGTSAFRNPSLGSVPHRRQS